MGPEGADLSGGALVPEGTLLLCCLFAPVLPGCPEGSFGGSALERRRVAFRQRVPKSTRATRGIERPEAPLSIELLELLEVVRGCLRPNASRGLLLAERTFELCIIDFRL